MLRETVPYEIYVVRTVRGRMIECADTHILFDRNMEEIFAQDLRPGETWLATEDGIELVASVERTGIWENMYDFEVDHPDHRYYANGFLSHNTVCVSAVLVWHVLFNKNYSILVAAHKGDKARDVLAVIKQMYELLPDFLQVGVLEWNKGNIVFETNSRVRATATSGTSARGDVANFVYVDEAAFIQTHVAEAFFQSVIPTISSGMSTKIAVTSTPKGLNHFHGMWRAAVEGKSGYAWTRIRWNEVPGRDDAFRAKIVSQFGENYWNQEFGAEFIGSSYTLVSAGKLLSLCETRPLVESPTTRVYAHPQSGGQYVVCADVSEGVMGDYSAAVVFDVTRLPYRIACVYRDNRISTMAYPQVLLNMARTYNGALVMVETTGIGQEVANDLLHQLEYENVALTQPSKRSLGRVLSGLFSGSPASRVGLRMDKQSKAVGCGKLKALVENDQLIVDDAWAVDELRRFSRDKKGSYAAEEGHDDVVMCLHRTGRVLTEDGEKTIKSIVDAHYFGRVMSINDEGRFVWNQIVGHSVRSNTNKPWVSLICARTARSILKCTPDHKCAVVRDIFNPYIEWVRADQTVGLYSVRYPQRDKPTWSRTSPLYNANQLAVIFGIIAGDGHVSKKGQFVTGHGRDQRDYSHYIHSIIGGKLSRTMYGGAGSWGPGTEKREGTSVLLPVNVQTKEMRRIFYPDGKKTLARALPYMNEVSLAFWYMDDGHCKPDHSYPRITLCTESFGRTDLTLIQEWMLSRFGIRSHITNDGRTVIGRKGEWEECHKFWRLVAPYICHSMRYKIPMSYRAIPLSALDANPLAFTALMVNDVKIAAGPTDSRLYDLEIENDHNFVVNDTVVHNCMVQFAWMADQGYMRETNDLSAAGTVLARSRQTIEDEMLPMGFSTQDPETPPVPVMASPEWWDQWANDTTRDPEPDPYVWDHINQRYPD